MADTNNTSHTYGAPSGDPVLPTAPANQGSQIPQNPQASEVSQSPSPQYIPQDASVYQDQQGSAQAHQNPQAYPGAQQPLPPQNLPVQQSTQSSLPPQNLQTYAQAPAPATAPGQVPVKQHVHHSYVWLGGLTAALTTVVILMFSTFMGLLGEGVNIVQGGDPGMILLMVGGVVLLFVVIAGLIIGIQSLAYKNLFYEVGEDEFSLYSGIFTKRKIHIPYQRIQSVNQRATLLQRLFGVCTVNIDTAGGASNKAVVVPYIRNTEAERLRTELFARKQKMIAAQAAAQSGVQAGAQAAIQATAQANAAVQLSAPQGVPVYTAAPGSAQAPQPAAAVNVLDAPAEYIADMRGVFGGEAVDTGVVTYEYGMSNKELVLSALSNNTSYAVVVVAIISGVMSLVGYAMQSRIGQSLVQQGVDIALDAITSNLIVYIVLGVLGIFVIVWGLSVIGTCISYGGFKACRRGNRIEVQHGLLQHQFHGVDIDRVQSVIIKQGFIRRFFGYCELTLGKIDALSGDSSEGQKNMPQRGLMVHPFVKLNRVPEILAGLVPEFAGVPTEQIKLPKVSLKRAIIRRCILHGSGLWLAVSVALFQIIFNMLITIDPSSTDPTIAVWLSLVNPFCVGAYVLCVVIVIFETVGSILWYKNSSFAYNHDFMQITNGGYSRESISFPRKKIQFSEVRSNPLQRRKRVATINARTAAGIAGTTMRLLDVGQSDADAWLSWSIPGGNA